MSKSKFKRALSVMLSSLMMLPLLTSSLVTTASAASGPVVVPMSSLSTASKALGIYNTDDVTGGVTHDYGANAGAYKFDEKEGALLLKKSTSDYMGSNYRFHVTPISGILTDQSWMIVSYKTNTSEKAQMTIASNASSSAFILAEDVSVSKDEYVWTTPVNVSSGKDGDVFARLQKSVHCALTVTLPKNTPDSTYFYIGEIAFFSSEADAKNYIESGALPEVSEDDTSDTPIGTGQFVGSTYTHEDCTIGTSLYVPKTYSPDKEYALLIYFHNAGKRGSGAVWASGTGNPLTKQVISKYGEEFIIFAPRCPVTPRQWVEQSWTPGVYDYASTNTSPAMDATISYIYDEIIAKYSIDMSRVYAFGDSMGGGGTWDLILREPDLVTAAVPVCGYNDPTQAMNIREDLDLWVHHTIQDKSVNVRGDRAMTATLKNLGRTNVIYTEYDSSNPEHKVLFNNAWESSTNWEHWAWEPAYNNKDVFEWLVSQKKPETLAPEVKSKFTDIDESDSYYKAVNYVADIGLFRGMTDTEFAPDGNVTREQFVTVLGRFAGVDTSKYTGVSFTDVDTVYGTWYAPYIEWAAQNNIVQGIGDGKFGVGTPITIQQACTILGRFVDHKAAPNDTQLTIAMYSDSSHIDTWAREGVQWALSSSVYMGKMGEKMYLNPTDNATRAQIAQMFYSYSIIFVK